MIRSSMAALALLASAGSASAQYYAAPPPPGYYAPAPVRPLGTRCAVRIQTGYGPQRLICPIVQAKPVGRGCACPAPPGYPPGYIGGRTIR